MKFKKNLLSIFLKNIKIICTSICLILMTTAFSISLPYIFSLIIGQHSNTTSFQYANFFSFFLFAYGCIWTGNHIVEQVRTLVITHVLEGTIRTLSITIFDHLHNLSLRFHLDRRSGALMNAIDHAQNGIETIFWSLFLFLIPVVIEIVLATFLVGYWYGILFSFIFGILTISYIFANICVLKKTNKIYEKHNQKRSDAHAALMDSLLNVETVRYFSNQKFEHEIYHTFLAEQEQAGIAKHRMNALIQLAQMVIIGMVFTIIIWRTGASVAKGILKISDFILIHGYFLQCIMPLNHCAYALQQLRKAWLDMSQIEKLLDVPSEIIDSDNAQPLIGSRADIDFKQVSFSYNKCPILQEISFEVSTGKTIAIVGQTGSGKSTIARLLFRFFDPITGSISINGQDIRSYTQESLHRAIGVVPQDTVLFNNTIYFNIAYGNVQASRQEVEQAARDAQLEEFINRLPDGYNTIVGERGLKLSGGEKQRIAIARVLLKKPLIYIFDEATSSLDSNTEYEIQKTIAQLSFDKTTLIIAHRLSTIMHADSILVLENGKIVEQGNHHELLAQQNLYAKLWNKQITN